MMNEVMSSLQPMIQALSDTFCVSVEMIKSNLPQYLEQFGVYKLFPNCIRIGLVSLLAGIAITGGLRAIYICSKGEKIYEERCAALAKKKGYDKEVTALYAACCPYDCLSYEERESCYYKAYEHAYIDAIIVTAGGAIFMLFGVLVEITQFLIDPKIYGALELLKLVQQ